MNPLRQTYTVEIAGLQRKLPLFEVAPGVRIAVFNMLGDTEFVQACARSLAEPLAQVYFDVLVTAEAKSIPLAHALVAFPFVVRSLAPSLGSISPRLRQAASKNDLPRIALILNVAIIQGAGETCRGVYPHAN